MNEKKNEPPLVIDNVVLNNSIFLRGAMNTNIKQGHHNAVVTLDKGGVLVELPEDTVNKKPRFVTLIPFSNVRQIQFETK